MNIDATRLFCDVAQHRSMSGAAELHAITQSAASQRVQGLEKELGVQLIDRSTRPLSLTAAGELYYRGCRRILSSYEKLTRRISEAGSGVRSADAPELRGEVNIVAIYSAGIGLLSQVKAGFERQNPRVVVEIEHLQPDAVYDRVRQEQCDFGIISYPKRWVGLASIPLREETMGLVVGPRHPLAGREQVHASELGPYEFVSFDISLPIGRHIRKYLTRHCTQARIVGQFDNIDSIKSYVEDSDAAAILPWRTVQKEVAAGTLAGVSLSPPLTRPLGIIYLRQRPHRPLAKAFIEYLLNHQPPVVKGTTAETVHA